MVYLVSLVLKLWHLLLAQVLHLPASLSWTLSVLLLVITIRSSILYFAFQQFISNRKSANLRPRLLEIRDYYSRHIDPSAPTYANFASKQLRENQGVKTSTLLVPALVQIPVIMGLVSMLRQMLLSAAAPGQPATHGVGFISREEVSQFLKATFFGQPLPAYLNMRADRFVALGITYSDLFRVVAPAIVAAAIFTGLNIVISSRRLARTLDYSNRVSVFLSRFMLAMIIFAPFSILFFGFVGPTAVALIIYWVFNNFWTLSQNLYLTRYIEKNYPLSDNFKAMQDLQKQQYNEARSEKKSLARSKRRMIATSILTPLRAKEAKAAYEAEKSERMQRRQAKKAQEQAQAMKIAQFRWAVGQMRPGAQDSLPSLTGGVPLHDGNVPYLPGVQKAREEMLKKQQKAQSTPRALLIASYLARSAGSGAKNKLRQATKKQPSKWKRFRE
nr:YidC/Oxa1 family membrane protein insertase [Corynebacterium lactis]